MVITYEQQAECDGARAGILRTEGTEALTAAVFEDTLFDPRLEQARA